MSSLLNISVPHYEVTIPSTGKKITIRPFLVKEEKLLLMAVAAGDSNSIIDATKRAIKDCIIDGNVNIDSLPFFDIDYLFIALRAKSIGENVEVKFRCKNVVGDIECGRLFKAVIDISNCSVRKPDLSNEVKLAGTHIVKLKYPSYATMKSVNENDAIINKKLALMAGSIDYIQQKDKVYSSKDLGAKGLMDFLENLTQAEFSKLEPWVDNLPSFVIKATAKCDKCGFTHNLEYTDYESFFA